MSLYESNQSGPRSMSSGLVSSVCARAAAAAAAAAVIAICEDYLIFNFFFCSLFSSKATEFVR